MTLEQYKQMINSINNQIKILEKNRSFLIEQNHDNLLHQIKKRQTNDKNWFINNFDAFWNNRHKFTKNTPYANIIIDFLELYSKENKKLCHITISDLLALWEMGFNYEGYPIIEYIYTRHMCKLSYVKNNQLIKVYGANKKATGFSKLLHGILEYLSDQKKDFSVFDEYPTLDIIKDVLKH